MRSWRNEALAGFQIWITEFSVSRNSFVAWSFKAANGQVVSSLRFNYMFPVPDQLISVRIIADEPDRTYRALLSQELRYCIKNQETIQHLAERTYRRVLLGKNPGLLVNSCNFELLEQAYSSYIQKEK